MSARCLRQKPLGQAFLERTLHTLNITLHIGAHRTGTTSFQRYMRASGTQLSERGVAFWGPEVTRGTVFSGVVSSLDGAVEKTLHDQFIEPVSSTLSSLLETQVHSLIVSEENILGSTRNNIRHCSLYSGAGNRVAQFAQAFKGRIKTILISPRSLENYWCSALAYGVARGLKVPPMQNRATIALSFRGWRDIITEVAQAVPDAEIRVLPFEDYAGRPDQFLANGTGIDAPACSSRTPVNESPRLPELRRAMNANGLDACDLPLGMGRWNPFTNEQHSALRELYADDMMWLHAGANGLATLVEDRGVTQAGNNLPLTAKRKGQIDEFEERRVARPG